MAEATAALPPQPPPNNNPCREPPQDASPNFMNLVEGLGGMQNWMQLMRMMKEMNTKAMEWMMGGIERIINAKLGGLDSQLSMSRQPSISCEIPSVDLGTRSLHTTSDNVASSPEAPKGLQKPRFLLDKKHELEDNGSMNDFSAAIRHVYDKHLKPYKKWADQTSDKQEEIRAQFRNGEDLNRYTISMKLGACGKIGEIICTEKSRGLRLERLTGRSCKKQCLRRQRPHMRKLVTSKLHLTAQESVGKKLGGQYNHHLGQEACQSSKNVMEVSVYHQFASLDVSILEFEV
ncbi:hypothetical protein R1flu_016429 [Riccia fluitans]|uniref:Uncharacterized protein n=1 Tax=Riccia fluitans TaxID=41844 RepID=A0ABD1YLT5_9MARC